MCIRDSTYTGGAFTSSSLKVEPVSASAFKGWSFGDADQGNLLGTIKSLDLLGVTPLNCSLNSNISVHSEDLHCAYGVVSRTGWAVIDDSDTYALDSTTGWWVEPNRDQSDLYLFAHGHEYKVALGDFVSVAGKIPLVPRAASGLWWTRWYDLNAADLRKVVDDYRSRSIPLDVFVLDMDWHKKNAWGGYSWDRHLLPNPSDTMNAYLKGKEKLVTLANLHDDDGVDTYDDQHAAMAAAMGLPSSVGKIPFDFCANETYARSLEDVVLQPLEKDGLDYWWIDWQQGGNHGGCAGKKQNPTIWTNKVRSTDHIRRGTSKRGMVLARWGGLGSHRYQVGFSGDVKDLSWENMAYQPYFSLTATNVGFGYWSHDITGPAGDYELYTRWIQWASYSGVFRSHDRGESAGGCDSTFPRSATSDQCSVVKVWNVPTENFEANRAAMTQRAKLVPYLYSLAREAYDTGVGPLRPLYYEFPEFDRAYSAQADGSYAQYMLGPSLLVAPIVHPASNKTDDLAPKSIWVPPGSWYDTLSGVVRTGSPDGSSVLTRGYALSETPVLVRAGAVIARRPLKAGDTVATAARPYSELEFSIYPGDTYGSTDVYEDDGETTAYLDANNTAAIHAEYQLDANVLNVSLTTTGSFASQPSSRLVSVRIVGVPPLDSQSSVTANGALLSYARFSGTPGTWSYDGAEATLVLEPAATPTHTSLMLSVAWSPGASTSRVHGFRGGVARAQMAKQTLDETRETLGAHNPGGGQLDLAAGAGEQLSGDCQMWQNITGGFGAQLKLALEEVNSLSLKGDDGPRRKAYVAALLQAAVDDLA
eukprot:TRINITY_DN16684_c0_g1_i3.p1 TRINITY_DN16684_c0_g1~~TRINITY_DN16684_c0_g1_i3.p1  ORF type:complete len:817 (-),score=152.03 TRINITY_DN16684_c0_g1_i3:124-2574(-)